MSVYTVFKQAKIFGNRTARNSYFVPLLRREDQAIKVNGSYFNLYKLKPFNP